MIIIKVLKTYSHLTPEEVKTIYQLLSAGKSIRKIASSVRRSNETVARVVRKFNSGKNLENIAEEYIFNRTRTASGHNYGSLLK